MFRFFSSLLGLTLFAAAAMVGVLLLARHETPLVADTPVQRPADVNWARALVRGRAFKDAKPGEDLQLELSPECLDVLADMLAQRLGGGHARVRLEDGGAELLASFPLPWQRGGYANLRLHMRDEEGLPEVVAASVGGLPLPAVLVQRLAQRGLQSLAWADLLQQVTLTANGAHIVYRWRPDALDAIGAGMLTQSERDRLGALQGQLSEVVAAQAPAGRLDLAELLAGLLARPQEPAADPIAENRAAILALAAYVNGRRLPLPGADRVPSRSVTLRGRHDLAQHFMASAALVVAGDSALSYLVGLTKELRDAAGGSGFSFADLMADRAGIRFAELATGSRAGARHLQHTARVGFDQDAIMPAIEGLPEGMQRAELQRGLGDVDSPAYRRLIAHIDRRIDNAGLYRDAPEKGS